MAHLHLLVNHLPIVGAIFSVALLAFGVLRRSDPVIKAAVGALAVAGLLAVGVYFTGEPAEDVVESVPGVTRALIHSHEEAAEVATIVMAVVALIAGGSLLRARGRALGRTVAILVLACGVGATATIGYAALLGGQIRHTEIRADANTAAGDVAEHERGER